MIEHPKRAIRAILCDIDGTLANTNHRKHYLECSPKNWDGWNEAAGKDTPHKDVALVVSAVKHEFCAKLILCTGRHESLRELTLDWLERYDIYFDELYMRVDNDFRPGLIIKQELLARICADGFKPIMVFDDRDVVVAMWRAAGLRCFQVAPGNF